MKHALELLVNCEEKGDYKQAYSVLENEVVKENELNAIVAERGGENYYVMARILKIFKKDTESMDSLFTKLSNVSIQ